MFLLLQFFKSFGHTFDDYFQYPRQRNSIINNLDADGSSFREIIWPSESKYIIMEVDGKTPWIFFVIAVDKMSRLVYYANPQGSIRKLEITNSLDF